MTGTTQTVTPCLVRSLGSTTVPVEEGEKRGRLIFTSVVFPSKSSETNALLLVESIRTFAGSFSQLPIWCLTPECAKQLSANVKNRLLALNVRLIRFKIDHETLRFPFAGEVIATALAESMSCGKTDFLAWLGTNTVVIQEPEDFLLQDGKNLGFRPVHHTLVGSRYEEPVDPFWTLIYRYCNVPKDRIFPMMTHVDKTRIRPYFNAGLLVTRPEKHLLRTWRDTFFKIYQEPSFQELYHQDKRYKIFVHQAVLSGVILSTFATDEIQELPPRYNYPLHLHAEDITNHRPTCLEELVTFRHERFYEDPEWMNKMPAREPLKKWIAERLAHTKKTDWLTK
jgi:hypothetical protein